MREIPRAPEQLGHELKLITQGVVDAGEIAMRAWQKGDISLITKGHYQGNVTEADLQTDTFLIAFLKKNFPGESIMTEESFQEGVKWGESFHVIDSIDGTNHFARSLHEWAVVYAHVQKGEIDRAVIYAPSLKEVYVARKGYGAYKDGKLMKVSARDKSHIGIQIGHDIIRYFRRTDIEERAIMFSDMHWITGSTSLALGRLANGQIELAVNMGQPVWDFAAGKLMIEEVGGKFTTFDGTQEFDFSGKNSNNFVASNGSHHKLGLQIVNPTVFGMPRS